MGSRVEPINAEELKDKLSSFEPEIPEDPFRESFVRTIINDRLERLVAEIKSLSKGFVLLSIHDRLDNLDNVQPVHVYEVDVVNDKDVLNVHIKVNIFKKIIKDSFQRKTLLFILRFFLPIN